MDSPDQFSVIKDRLAQTSQLLAESAERIRVLSESVENFHEFNAKAKELVERAQTELKEAIDRHSPSSGEKQ